MTTPTRSVARLAPARRPITGADYVAVLRNPRHRWWRPFVSILLVALLAGIALVVPMLVAMIVDVAYGDGELLLGDESAFLAPGPMLALNIAFGLFIVACLVAVRVAHPVAARFLHSVEGRVRWGWLARCVLLLLPVWIVYVGVVWFVDGATLVPRSEHWVLYIVMAFTVVPFQAAGEEYLFRGWVMASLGSWFRDGRIALVLAMIVSSAGFATAHGSPDPWVLLDLAGMSVACVVLTWRTGGLEAAVALHAVNNVVVMTIGSLTGGLADSYIDESTAGTPGQAAVSLTMSILATLLLLWAARRHGVARVVPEGVGVAPYSERVSPSREQ